MTDAIQTIVDAVQGAYRDLESRRCTVCRKTGRFGGDYPIPVGAHRDVFAHVGCWADELHEISRYEEARLRELEDQEF